MRLGYVVVPDALRQAFILAKRLTDRHSPLMEQEALAELLASGAYERHVRSARRRNAERREVLLEALRQSFGGSVSVTGAEAGLHLVLWLPNAALDQESAILTAARAAGIGLYPISPLYDPAGPGPTSVGLVMGYAALEADAIRRGVRTLKNVFGGDAALSGLGVHETLGDA